MLKLRFEFIRKLTMRSLLNLFAKQNNRSQILVSVVIPIYDRVDELQTSIESILAQSMRRFELILVCDGSPSETMAVVEKYRHHPNVRVFTYPDNSGNAVRGRNRAIREARGKYLAFQDSDDIASPRRLEISVQWLEAYNADVVYGGWKAKLEGDRKIDGLSDGQNIFSPECDYEKLREICVPCQSTVMAKTEALRAVGGLKPEMRYLEDYELWMRLAHLGYRFKAIPEVLTTLRLHSGNLELTFQEAASSWHQKLEEEHRRIPRWMPRIAYLIPGKGISGGSAIICQHANRLKRRGFDILLIDVLDEDRPFDWFPGLDVEIFGLSQAPANIDIGIATGWQTVEYLERLSINRKMYFVQSDERRFTDDPYIKRFIHNTYNRKWEYFTEAKWIQKWLHDEFGHAAVYAPNGLDPDIISPAEPLEPKTGKVRVLLEGPISVPFKGMKDAFAAVQDLDCEVWCVSSCGKPEPEWRCDRFFEAVPMNEMKYIYSSCDVLLKMSRVEGFFGPPLEMMACGGTAVVAKVTGYDEYIVDGQNALVVEQGDVENARKAIQRLMEDPVFRENLIAAGRNTSAQWKWDSTIDTLETLFLGKEQAK